MRSLDADVRPVEGPEANEELASLAKAIAHPARVQIVRILLARASRTCGQLVEELPFAQSTVSQHLAMMTKAGLLGTGPAGDYHVEPHALRRLRVLIGAL